MKEYSKLTIVMLGLYFIPLILDYLSTYLIMFKKEGHTLSEANPIFIALGGDHFTYGIFLILHSIFFFWLITRQGSISYRWILLSLIVWLLLARGLAIYSHILHYLNPVSIAQATTAAVYQSTAKVAWYTKLVGLIVYLPILLQWLTLKLFRIDYDIVEKDK